MTEKKNPLASLFSSLIKAQAEVNAVRKDKRNDFHGFDYASAEAVLTEGKRALNENGLAIVIEGPAIKERQTVVTVTIVHESGESLEIAPFTLPIVDQKGKAPDKAVLSCVTESMSYVYRNVLGIPRVDKDADISGRDDRNYQERRPGLQDNAAMKALADHAKEIGLPPSAVIATAQSMYEKSPRELDDLQLEKLTMTLDELALEEAAKKAEESK